MNLETLAREFNPKNDLSRHHHDDSFTGTMKNIGAFAINSGKSIVRGMSVGAIIGGTAGAFYGLYTGEHAGKYSLTGVILGANIGMTADYLLYISRYTLNKIFPQHSTTP